MLHTFGSTGDIWTLCLVQDRGLIMHALANAAADAVACDDGDVVSFTLFTDFTSQLHEKHIIRFVCTENQANVSKQNKHDG